MRTSSDALVQRLRDLLDDVEAGRARDPALDNGRRPSADEVQNLITSRSAIRDQRSEGVAGDLHLKAARSSPPKQQQVWVAQQEIKVAETRANAKPTDQARHDIIRRARSRPRKAKKEMVEATCASSSRSRKNIRTVD